MKQNKVKTNGLTKVGQLLLIAACFGLMTLGLGCQNDPEEQAGASTCVGAKCDAISAGTSLAVGPITQKKVAECSGFYSEPITSSTAAIIRNGVLVVQQMNISLQDAADISATASVAATTITVRLKDVSDVTARCNGLFDLEIPLCGALEEGVAYQVVVVLVDTRSNEEEGIGQADVKGEKLDSSACTAPEVPWAQTQSLFSVRDVGPCSMIGLSHDMNPGSDEWVVQPEYKMSSAEKATLVLNASDWLKKSVSLKLAGAEGLLTESVSYRIQPFTHYLNDPRRLTAFAVLIQNKADKAKYKDATVFAGEPQPTGFSAFVLFGTEFPSKSPSGELTCQPITEFIPATLEAETCYWLDGRTTPYCW